MPIRLALSGSILALVAGRAIAAPVLLETFTPGDSTYASGGWVLQGGDSFLGVRFAVDAAMQLDAIVGNLGGSGDFFVAIARIDEGDEAPSLPPDFAPGDVLFYATNSFGGSTSRDVRTAANVGLDTGRYLVFFGGLGPFGESDYGWMPNAPDLMDSLVPLGEYFEYRGSSWTAFPESGIRVVLEGSPTAVPLPAGFLLMLTAFAAAGRHVVARVRRGAASGLRPAASPRS
jgi:hypothetical protein